MIRGGRARGRMENLIGPLAFVVVGVTLLALAGALVASQVSLDTAWQWIESLPLVPQAVVWLLLLPVVGVAPRWLREDRS